MGVPQGCILSVTLFSVQINSITHCLKPSIDCCYMSMVFIFATDPIIIERQLQLCLNKHQPWSTDNGFRFSNIKTVCMDICQKRGLHLDPQLFLDKKTYSGGG